MNGKNNREKKEIPPSPTLTKTLKNAIRYMENK